MRPRKPVLVNKALREPKSDDEYRRAVEKLEVLLLEGLKSGHPIEVTPEYWSKKRREFRQKQGVDSTVRTQYEKVIAIEDALWAGQAEAVEAKGGYLSEEESMKALFNLVPSSAVAKRKQNVRKKS